MCLSGRDMIGIAKTGSGKTMAFGVPSVVHALGKALLSFSFSVLSDRAVYLGFTGSCLLLNNPDRMPLFTDAYLRACAFIVCAPLLTLRTWHRALTFPHIR